MRRRLPLTQRIGRFIDRNPGLVFANIVAFGATVAAFAAVFGPHLS